MDDSQDRLSSHSDRTLLRRFRAGDEDAATALYRRYAERLAQLARTQTDRRLAPRFDSQDVVQSVFRTFFRRAAKGHYDVPDGEALWKLLLVIALNKIRSLAERHQAARRNVENTRSLEGIGAEASATVDNDELPYLALKWTIEEAASELPPLKQDMVWLRIEGHDVATIAERTGRSKRTVERTLQQFRERLERVLGDEGSG